LRRRALPAAVLVAACVACLAGARTAAAVVDPSRAQADVDSAMHSGNYPFCRKPREPLSPDALALCPHASALADCDGFAAACVRPDSRRFDFDLPRWLSHVVGGIVGFLARLVEWVLLPGLCIALLVPAIRALLSKRVDEGEPFTPDLVAAAAVVTPEVVHASDEVTLLARADDHARRHAYDVAVELYLAASLASLDRRGALHLSRERTNGEYVRACADPVAKTSLRGLAAVADRVKFGGAPATEEAATRAGAAARSIVHGVVTALAMLALLSCVGCGGGAWPGTPRPGDDPAGKELLFDLLHRQGFRADYVGGSLASLPLPEPGERAAAVIVDLDRTDIDPETSAHLVEWVSAGGSLVLAGAPEEWPTAFGITQGPFSTSVGVEAKRLLARAGRDAAGDDPDDDEDPDDLPASTPAAATYASATAHGTVAASRGLKVGPDADRVAWLDDGTTYAVEVPYGLGWVTGVGSSELFTNVALLRPGNAATALAILSNADREELAVAQPEDGVSPPSSPVAALERAGLSLGLVHALGAALLLFLAVGVRLTRPVLDPPPARRAFVEHVEAVGELYRRGGHAAHALIAFARFAEQRLRAKVPRGAPDMPSVLAARARVPLDVCQRIWSRATSVNAAAPVGDELGILKELAAVYSLSMDKER
jgi:hypothetical protein